MNSDTPTNDRCNATTRDGGDCQNHPGEGADRCHLHGAQRGDRPAPREAADPATVLGYLAETNPAAHEWVLAQYESYLEAAPFDDENAKADQLKQVAAQEYLIWTATEIQLREGVVLRTDDGDVDEHPVNLALDRMQRTVTRRLNALGVLGTTADQQAPAADGVETLRELMSDLDEDDATAAEEDDP